MDASGPSSVEYKAAVAARVSRRRRRWAASNKDPFAKLFGRAANFVQWSAPTGSASDRPWDQSLRRRQQRAARAHWPPRRQAHRALCFRRILHLRARRSTNRHGCRSPRATPAAQQRMARACVTLAATVTVASAITPVSEVGSLFTVLGRAITFPERSARIAIPTMRRTAQRLKGTPRIFYSTSVKIVNVARWHHGQAIDSSRSLVLSPRKVGRQQGCYHPSNCLCRGFHGLFPSCGKSWLWRIGRKNLGQTIGRINAPVIENRIRPKPSKRNRCRPWTRIEFSVEVTRLASDVSQTSCTRHSAGPAETRAATRPFDPPARRARVRIGGLVVVSSDLRRRPLFATRSTTHSLVTSPTTCEFGVGRTTVKTAPEPTAWAPVGSGGGRRPQTPTY